MTQSHQQAKEKKDRYTSRPRRRGALAHHNRPSSERTSTQAGQGLEGHRNTSRSGRTDQRGMEERDTGTSVRKDKMDNRTPARKGDTCTGTPTGEGLDLHR
jgi:hypothetical protein